jgi:hypothetical protein
MPHAIHHDIKFASRFDRTRPHRSSEIRFQPFAAAAKRWNEILLKSSCLGLLNKAFGAHLHRKNSGEKAIID